MLLSVNKPQPSRLKKLDSEAVSYGEKKMGFIYADIELISSDDLALHYRGFLPEDDIKRMKVTFLVDSGAYSLVINEHIRQQLDLRIIEETSVRLADDSEMKVKLAGPVELRFENRRATVDAFVFPGNTEPLLGVIPMESMDVLVDPKQQRLIVNPANPIIPTFYVKRAA
jgi:clan AA aspartic protease